LPVDDRESLNDDRLSDKLDRSLLFRLRQLF